MLTFYWLCPVYANYWLKNVLCVRYHPTLASAVLPCSVLILRRPRSGLGHAGQDAPGGQAAR